MLIIKALSLFSVVMDESEPFVLGLLTFPIYRPTWPYKALFVKQRKTKSNEIKKNCQ